MVGEKNWICCIINISLVWKIETLRNWIYLLNWFNCHCKTVKVRMVKTTLQTTTTLELDSLCACLFTYSLNIIFKEIWELNRQFNSKLCLNLRSYSNEWLPCLPWSSANYFRRLNYLMHILERVKNVTRKRHSTSIRDHGKSWDLGVILTILLCQSDSRVPQLGDSNCSVKTPGTVYAPGDCPPFH